MKKSPRAPTKTKPRRLCARVRAVWDDDKESRSQDFLNNAAKLFEMQDYEAISVADICKAAGLAKGTFYLYFETKEEVFLALTKQEISKWVSALNENMVTLRQTPPATKLATTLAESFRTTPHLPRLLQMLHSILERNASEEAIVLFKKDVAAGLDSQATILCKMYPQLSAAQIQVFMLFCQTTLTGTWQYANPPPKVREILERNGMQRFLFDFETAVVHQVVTFLNGLGIQ